MSIVVLEFYYNNKTPVRIYVIGGEIFHNIIPMVSEYFQCFSSLSSCGLFCEIKYLKPSINCKCHSHIISARKSDVDIPKLDIRGSRVYMIVAILSVFKIIFFNPNVSKILHNILCLYQVVNCWRAISKESEQIHENVEGEQWKLMNYECYVT